jgi:hypothetical protein
MIKISRNPFLITNPYKQDSKKTKKKFPLELLSESDTRSLGA